jgi:seryl-tRNA synthetase
MVASIHGAYEAAERAERTAGQAHEHALSAHEKVGELWKENAAEHLKTRNMVLSEHEKTRRQVTALAHRVEILLRLDKDMRAKLESLPELVEEEITAHGQKKAAQHWTSLTKQSGKAFWGVVAALLAGLAFGAGAMVRELVQAMIHK